jgi:glucan phosphoethanolaminetransferase (alkaline phosphatase superfamily)
MSDISDNRLKDSVQKPRPDPLLTWALTIAACAYFVWSGISLYYSVGIFASMFGNIGVDLHLSTKLVLSFYWWALPLVFGGAVVLIIGKQFFVRDKWISLTLTLAVTVVIAVVSNVITRALYRPFFDLVDKLSK